MSSRRVLCLLSSVTMLLSVEAQLRPRRVGVGSLGESEPTAEAAGDPLASLTQGAQGGDPMEALSAMMQNLGGGGEGSAESRAMMEEMNRLASDPKLMQEKMREVMQMMGSQDGGKIMEEVQSVLTDPEKMRAGLEQFASNPMLKEMAAGIPGLKQVLDDPEVMEKSIAEAQNALREMGGLEGMQEKMAEMMGNMKEGDLEGLLGGLGEGAQEMLANLNQGGEDGDLQARVREQLAQMLQNRGGDEEPGAVDIDEF